jgi:hypothetical protein
MTRIMTLIPLVCIALLVANRGHAVFGGLQSGPGWSEAPQIGNPQFTGAVPVSVTALPCSASSCIVWVTTKDGNLYYCNKDQLEATAGTFSCMVTNYFGPGSGR